MEVGGTTSFRTVRGRLRSFGMIAFAVTCMTVGAFRVASQGAVETTEAAASAPAQAPAEAAPCGTAVTILQRPAETVATGTGFCAPEARSIDVRPANSTSLRS